jgi:hypothetical protein
MIWTLFAVGTLWFWLLLIISSGIIIHLIEYTDSAYSSFIWVILVLSIFYFFGGSVNIKSVGAFIVDQPDHALGILVSYFVIGLIWTIIKWYFFLLDIKDTLVEKFKRNAKLSPQFDIKEYYPSEYSQKLISWAIYWPLSCIWTIISNPVRRIFTWLINRLESTYIALTNRILRQFQLTNKQ